MLKVLVLGCGPAGLMAAQGCMDAAQSRPWRESVEVAVVSRKVKSPIYGCQYLHKPIPNYTPIAVRNVSYQMRGEAFDYRHKVYGPMWDGTVSPEDLSEEHLAWDLRGTYDALWDQWEPAILNGDVDPAGLRDLATSGDIGPHLIINSIPRPAICHAGHSFAATEIWAAGDAPELGIRIPFQCPEDLVICNGEDNPGWYRMSRVFGHTTVEWPGDIERVPVTTASRVKKPLQHQCDCWSDLPIMHVGRYGEWAKGVLSHTAYFKSFKKIELMMEQRHGAPA